MLAYGMRGAVFVVGLQFEARLAQRLGASVVIGGGTAAGAEAAVSQALATGAAAVVSFGLAGGLDPSLRAGDIVVPRAVRCGAVELSTDPRLNEWLGGATPHLLLGACEVVADIAAKRRLWQNTGAAVIDVESGAVARGSAERGVPFAALRAVCDPAGQSLPAAALVALSATGVVGLTRVLSSIAASPRQLASLVSLSVGASAARRSLARRLAAMDL